MKKIISFSLYGANPFYTRGAIANAKQVHNFYPNWICRFYVGSSVPQEVIQQLLNLEAEVIPMQGEENNFASMWRFLVFADPDVEIALLRDTDSRFSKREIFAVQEWLKSGKNFHIMRDHPCHDMPIMAGMWGAKCKALPDIEQLITDNYQKNRYGADQFFLRKMLYLRAKSDSCIHASFWAYEKHAKPFSTPRDGLEFIGERIDENEKPCLEERAIIAKYEQSFLHKTYLQIKFHIRKAILILRTHYV